MRLKKATLFLISVLFLLACAGVATTRAQGVIVPGRCDRCPQPPRPVNLPRALPVRTININTKISGQIATTHLEQIFTNETDATLEGTYLFPIPEAASIVEFAIWDGNNRLVGEVRSREEARQIYDAIVRRQRDPGLLEYAGKDLFQASIFPILPHSDKKLELTYTQVLKAESGTVSYRYPLGTGRQLVSIGNVSGNVEIDSKDPIRNVYSPSHDIALANHGSRNARVTFNVKGGREAQDFQLFYALSRDDFGLSLLTYREPGKDGYFLLMLSPKEELTEQEYAAKDIVFVLDTSGSMNEAGKMEKARAALLFGIRSLRPDDRFNVISFAGEERLMESGLINADAQGLARGEKFVKALRPSGGTNINDSLLAALKQFRGSERPQLLVFMTDGLPTVSETNVERIVDNVRKERQTNVRLFTFGVGYDVNTALLDKLAAENNGAADYVEPKEDLEVRVSNFFTKVNYPVLTDLKLDMGGVETDLIYPRSMPDLFKGAQITLIGRYSNERDLSNIRLRLSGKTGRELRSFNYEQLQFPLRDDENDFLPRLWATRRVGWLMEQVRTNGEQKELRDEIVDLGTRYGIVTPYTSYLAVEQNMADAVTDQSVTAGRRDNRPSSSNNRGVFGATGSGARTKSAQAPSAAAPVDNLATLSSGADAVKESKRARAQQESVSVKDDESSISTSVARKVGGKTFYQREGVWMDADFKAGAKMPETVLTFGSDEYFALLKREPRLGEYFALGERVVVVLDGRVYRVAP